VSDERAVTRAGRVYLIGAGPGAPDLITLRALRAIQASDLVICDRILGQDFLAQLGIELGGKECRWLGSGRQGPERQRAINEQMRDAARAGRIVARVKNGDPLVFGRGGEEAEFLGAAGVRWELIPGLSSVIAPLTAAGYAITDRGRGRSFAVVSARLAGGAFNERFPNADSLLVLMGFGVLPRIRERLIADGWAADTPAVLIERGSMCFERRVTAALQDIDAEAEAAGVASPALLALGTVAARRYRSPERPLLLFAGRDADRYRELGELLPWPALQVSGARHPLLGRPLPAHDGLVFTTPEELHAWHDCYGDAGFAAGLCCPDQVCATAARELAPEAEVLVVEVGDAAECD